MRGLRRGTDGPVKPLRRTITSFTIGSSSTRSGPGRCRPHRRCELFATICLLRARPKVSRALLLFTKANGSFDRPSFILFPLFFSPSKPFYLTVVSPPPPSSRHRRPSMLSGAALSYSTIKYSTTNYYGFLVTAAFYFARTARLTARDGNLYILIQSNLIFRGAEYAIKTSRTYLVAITLRFAGHCVWRPIVHCTFSNVSI